MAIDTAMPVRDAEADVVNGQPPARRPLRVVLALLAVFGLLAAGGLAGRWLGPGTPKDTSVEAGFARDMRTHHAQAVSMAMVEYQRTSSPELRAVAYDIALGQQREIGILDGWLQSWGLRASSSTPAMAWMAGADGHGHAGMPAMPAAAMPGMATSAELNQLNTASGAQLDRLFLSLMIRHHQGGLEMAQTGLDRSDNELIDRFAQRVVLNQRAEIEQMQRDLAALPG